MAISLYYIVIAHLHAHLVQTVVLFSPPGTTTTKPTDCQLSLLATYKNMFLLVRGAGSNLGQGGGQHLEKGHLVLF